MKTGTYLKIAIVTALTAATVAVAPATVAAPDSAVPASSAPGQASAPAWHTSLAGTLSDNSALFDIASVGPNAAWAVGVQYVDGIGQGVILHWNGRTWQQQSTPGVPATGVWHAVDAVSVHDVWAYGWDQQGEILAHYDGKRWTQTPLPDEKGYGFAKLAAVPGKVWLVSNTAINSYAHGVWQSTPLQAGVGITAIEARTSNDAWAVGQFAYVGQPSRSVLLHWDGSSWTDVAPAGSAIRVTAVYQESARSVWVTALTPYVEDKPQQTKVLHWDGHSWHDVTGPVGGLWAGAITGDGKGTVWVSGDPYGYEGTALYWRLRDGVWTSVAGDAVPGGQTQSYDIEALAPTGRKGQFWSVGHYGLITGESTSAQYELIQRSTR
ncbi:hypothetical protein OHT59_45945 [Streptomyces sp. NBC_00243]|uniref:hypothetical protein n=1 Tax=Streptomyces sp. NBC_00243 TaxID=2975688 RepID=UPI002DDB2C52|nr:hypothetical protein [Streptomyces sp. NBC_00243]WRZ25356.1 hypothetical protein OHT59_45945 [Streptomyces sp. NBC_00243]